MVLHEWPSIEFSLSVKSFDGLDLSESLHHSYPRGQLKHSLLLLLTPREFDLSTCDIQRKVVSSVFEQQIAIYVLFPQRVLFSILCPYKIV